MNFNNIPQELKESALFCAWKLTNKGKEPFDVKTDKHARSNDKSTFVSFEIILQHLYRYYKTDGEGKMLGGLGLGIFNGFSAIDIDHCVNVEGIPNDIAKDIIDFCQSYTELSPSKTGIRIIFKTDTMLDKARYYINNHKLGLEIYISENTNKYVTLTGDAINTFKINHINISYILDKYMRKETASPIEYKEFNIDKYNDKKLKELWNNIAPGSNSNESELDLALCNKLAYYLHNYEAVNSAFVSSPYFNSKDIKHKNKWLKRNDYRQSTIMQAIQSINKYKGASKFTMTDTGNAHRMMRKYKNVIRYNVDNKMWMLYNGENWQTDIDGNIKNYAELLTEEMKIEARKIEDEDIKKAANKNITRTLNASGKAAMIAETQHLEGIPVINNDFDKQTYLFNTKSGIIDLQKRVIIAHNPELMLSKIAPYKVSFEKPVKWLKFLNEIFENDEEVVKYIQRIIGYSLTSDTSERCMFILIGNGMNGKSVLLDVIRQILGSYATTSDVNILLDKKSQSNGNLGDVARLNGMRCVVTNEAELTDRLKESVIKTITSGNDNIVARFLYGNEFEFTPISKIFMASNYKPRIIGTDLGIWSRIRMIMFNVEFNEKNQDKHLKEKLITEADKILGWAINGCTEWLQYGLKEPDKFKNAKKEYRSEMDIVQQWAEENCVADPNYKEKAGDLFENFSNYAIKNKEYQLTNTMFGRSLSKKFKKKRYLGSTYYFGIRIIEKYGDILSNKEKNEI